MPLFSISEIHNDLPFTKQHRTLEYTTHFPHPMNVLQEELKDASLCALPFPGSGDVLRVELPRETLNNSSVRQ